MEGLQTVPLEIQEEFLLPLSSSELLSVCQTNSYYRSLCSDARFWRKKFAREGLPLLEEGSDAQTWLKIYNRSFQADRKAQKYLGEERLGLIKIAITPANINLLSTARISPADIEELLSLEGQKVRLKSAGAELLQRENPLITPQSELGLRRLLPHGYISFSNWMLEWDTGDPYSLYELNLIDNEGQIIFRLIARGHGGGKIYIDFPLSKEDLNYLLYKFFYFGLITEGLSVENNP